LEAFLSHVRTLQLTATYCNTHTHSHTYTDSERQLSVVFPVSGFEFGRLSQPWLQILVRDVKAHARGVREIAFVLQVHIDGNIPAVCCSVLQCVS